MYLTYVALVHKAEKKSAPYGVIFPDFPGCVFSGKTVDIALKKARQGLIFHIEGMLNEGETLPEPSPLEAILPEITEKNVIASLINIIPPVGHLKRVNISMDAALLAEIDFAAQQSGKNRSEFLTEAALYMLS